jgi:hypothetical protein
MGNGPHTRARSRLRSLRASRAGAGLIVTAAALAKRGEPYPPSQPRVGHSREGPAHRREPRQPVGHGGRPVDAAVGGRQRRRRRHYLPGRPEKAAGLDRAAGRRHPGRRANGPGVQPDERVRRSVGDVLRTGAVHLRVRGREHHGLEPGRAAAPVLDPGAARSPHGRRDLQGAGDCLGRRPDVPVRDRPSTTAASTCSTPASPPRR